MQQDIYRTWRPLAASNLTFATATDTATDCATLMLCARIARLERENRFRVWLSFKRFLESLTDQQLELYARHGQLPDALPEPLPLGASKLDGLDRKSLIRLFEEDERKFSGRSEEELNFYIAHGHWPEQPCDERCCKKVEGVAPQAGEM